jgi:hypothetical protein
MGTERGSLRGKRSRGNGPSRRGETLVVDLRIPGDVPEIADFLDEGRHTPR